MHLFRNKYKVIALLSAFTLIATCFSGCVSEGIVDETSETIDIDIGSFYVDEVTLVPADPDPITTEGPEVTTAPEVTASPEVTTEPPEVTTEPPEVTTAPPEVTTTPPEITTTPPEVTTTPPEVTTAPPEVTTAPPEVTTEPPEVTTAPPEVTTEPPEVTTAPPEVTTEPPEVTTAPPEVTTEPPEVTTEPPEVTTTPPESTTEPPVTTKDPVSSGLSNEVENLQNGEAAIPLAVTVIPSGTLVKSGGDAVIDYSNTADGYIMVKYQNDTGKRIKVQVKGPKTTYSYNLTPGKWEAFPLSDEDGTYKIGVYLNVEGTKYATVVSLTVNVKLKEPFAPFVRSNQYVDFDNAPNTVRKAAEICNGLETLDKVNAVYQYVVRNFKYDTHLASTVKSGYLPDLDKVLESKKGICFDYAAMMAGMLRSQGVPCKLIVGYAGSEYHAWISVWSEKTGWIEGVVYFNGTTWSRMDPTFASTGAHSNAIMNYINDDANYTVKYIY